MRASVSRFHEEIRRQFDRRIDRVSGKICHAGALEDLIIYTEIAAELPAWSCQDHMGRIAHDFWLARSPRQLIAAQEVLNRGRRNRRARPKRVDRNALLAKFPGHTEDAHAHAKLWKPGTCRGY